MQEFLLGAAAELQTLCLSAAPAEADSNGGGNGAKHARKRIRSLLLRMEGVVIGARTCLPDFEHSAPPGALLLLWVKWVMFVCSWNIYVGNYLP